MILTELSYILQVDLVLSEVAEDVELGLPSYAYLAPSPFFKVGFKRPETLCERILCITPVLASAQ